MTQKRYGRWDKQRRRLGRRHLGAAWTGVVLCSGFLVVGILLFIGGIREWQIGSASINWPATQAEITHTQMVKGFLAPRRGGITFAENEREISVRYTANGADYTTDFRLPSDASNSSIPNPPHRGFSTANNIEQMTLYYNPENPREVVIHPGDQTTAVYGIAFGGTATVVCSMFIFALASWLSKPGRND